MMPPPYYRYEVIYDAIAVRHVVHALACVESRPSITSGCSPEFVHRLHDFKAKLQKSIALNREKPSLKRLEIPIYDIKIKPSAGEFHALDKVFIWMPDDDEAAMMYVDTWIMATFEVSGAT